MRFSQPVIAIFAGILIVGGLVLAALSWAGVITADTGDILVFLGALGALVGVGFTQVRQRDRTTDEVIGQKAAERRRGEAPIVKALVLAASAGPILIAISGCASAGVEARERLLAPAVVTAWPDIEAWAHRGIDDMIDDGEVGDLGAASHRLRLDQFGAAIEDLR